MRANPSLSGSTAVTAITPPAQPVTAHSISCPYTCGELFQGTLEERACLVSCPITSYSTAQTTPGRAQPSLPEKARRALESFPIGSLPPISLRQRLPSGRGYGSSTADIGSVLFTAARWAGITLDPLQASQLAVGIEPTDSSLFPGLTLFDHRRAEFHEILGSALPVAIVIVDPGGMVDSEAFNTHDWTATLKKMAPLHRQAFDLLKQGIVSQNIPALGAAATMSAKAHQEILNNPWLDPVLALSDQIGASGVCRAHSGTILGILFPESSFDKEAVVPYIKKRLPAQIRLRVTELSGGGPIEQRRILMQG